MFGSVGVVLEDGTHKILLCATGEVDDCSEKMKDFFDFHNNQENTSRGVGFGW